MHSLSISLQTYDVCHQLCSMLRIIVPYSVMAFNSIYHKSDNKKAVTACNILQTVTALYYLLYSATY